MDRARLMGRVSVIVTLDEVTSGCRGITPELSCERACPRADAIYNGTAI